MNYVLAFLAGILGACTGGNAAFVMTGFIGIVVAIMQKCGADVTVISDQFLNLVFMPCVIFNGANAALAYSANIKKYMPNGQDLNKSMYPIHDPIVLLVGGVFGLLGYLVFVGLTKIGFPSDLGACSVTLVSLLVRFLFGDKLYINKNIELVSKEKGITEYVFNALMAGVIAYVTAYFVQLSGIVSIGFSVSALTILFLFIDPGFPATHQITIIAGYAIMQTGNFGLAVAFGILAQMIFMVSNKIINTNVKTHQDGPAMAIWICSLLIFTLF